LPPSGQLPFQADPAEQNASEDAGHPSVPAEARSRLPFPGSAGSRMLPVGTLITVRLDRSVENTDVHPGEVFMAVVAETVTINGNVIIPRGTHATGEIESTQQSFRSRNPGYTRLTLSALTIDGRRLPVQTSSLFAPSRRENNGTRENGQDEISLHKGRRLTFRLTAATPLDDQNAMADRRQALTNTGQMDGLR
jgi:hypothetical protein